MGPTWGRQGRGGPHVGPMNLAIRAIIIQVRCLGRYRTKRVLVFVQATTFINEIYRHKRVPTERDKRQTEAESRISIWGRGIHRDTRLCVCVCVCVCVGGGGGGGGGGGVESKYMIHTVVYLYIFQYGPNTSFITILYILRPLIQFCIEKSYLKKNYGGRAPGARPSKSALARPQHQACSSNHHCAKIPKTSIWKKTPKPFVRGIHQRLMDSISQWASNAESISMSWRHMMCRLAVMSTVTGRPSTQLDWQGSSSDPVKVLEFETVYCSIGKVRKFCV